LWFNEAMKLVLPDEIATATTSTHDSWLFASMSITTSSRPLSSVRSPLKRMREFANHRNHGSGQRVAAGHGAGDCDQNSARLKEDNEQEL